MGVRINKYLSESGICSRREADSFIEQGRVEINGVTAQIGSRVEAMDSVTVDGEKLRNSKKRIYIAFNKPPGVTSTTDTRDPSNIVDYIDHHERIFNIGRLDKPSEGLIFMTNDGDIVNKILRAGNQHEKEYIVTVNKSVTDDFIRRMSTGVAILGTTTKPCRVTREGEKCVRIVLTQGLNRQIRRMCEALDYKVVTLKRIRVMNITLAGLERGKWRYFTEAEINELHRMIELSSGTEEASDIATGTSRKKKFKKETTPEIAPKKPFKGDSAPKKEGFARKIGSVVRKAGERRDERINAKDSSIVFEGESKSGRGSRGKSRRMESKPAPKKDQSRAYQPKQEKRNKKR